VKPGVEVLRLRCGDMKLKAAKKKVAVEDGSESPFKVNWAELNRSKVAGLSV
jgi:hypothetical protein